MNRKIHIPSWMEVLELICNEKGLSLSALLNEGEQMELRDRDQKVNILVNPPVQYTNNQDE